MEVKKTADALQDKELVLRAQKGDCEAMNALILKYQDLVFNLAYRHLNHYDEARECSQEVFLSVFKGIGSFRLQSSFKTWLYRVTVNRAIRDYHKKKKKDYHMLYLRNVSNPVKNDQSDEKEYDIPDTSSVPYNEMDKKERMDLLQQAIASVKDIYRIPLVLRDIEGLSYEEVSNVLEIDIGTVKSRISRGREHLRAIICRDRKYNEIP